VIIREVLPEDLPAVGELRVTAYRALGLLPEGSGYADVLRKLGFDGSAEILVAETGDDLLGTITLKPWGDDSELAAGPDEADIRAFAVAPGAQGQGVGRELLQALIELATRRGVRNLRLCTTPAMTTAQRLYAAAGFVRTPELDFEPVPGVTLLAYALTLPSES
jgi:ribosomal protein S18 acetylase RimI-like enzyme